ncbi:hypothetical protein EDD16DRAFT_1733547 [Pisolithus croceorrhizus]|nr:hypothetical protein EDD16DRAFT_1733547 [Pisolithus croceorrhizus]
MDGTSSKVLTGGGSRENSPKDNGWAKPHETRGDGEGECREDIGKETERTCAPHPEISANRPKTPRHTKIQISRQGLHESRHEGSMRGGKRRPLINDRWGNRYETVGSGRGHLGRDGEKGTRPIDLPGPEISAKSPRTPSTHRNSHISTTVERVGTKRASPGSHKKVVPPCQEARGATRKYRLGDARLQEANDSARNCMSYGQSEVESNKTPGGDGDARGESGERGIGGKRAPVAEISAKLSHTLLSTEKTHISTTDERVLKKKVSPGSHKPVEPPCIVYRRWEDGIASGSNHWAEFYETSGGDREARAELGERGNTRNGAPNPEIFAKWCDTACLPKNRDIFACVGAIATKGIPLERYRRVHPESRFARGTDEWSSRYRVGEVGG